MQTLQTVVEDDSSWSADEDAQLRHLRSVIKRIDHLQRQQSFEDIRPSRTLSDLTNLTTWSLKEHGVDLDSAGLRPGFVDSDVNNATLFATRQITAGDTMVVVPESMILNARSSGCDVFKNDLNTLAQHGPAINRSPSLALSIVLLMHRYKPNQSTYMPYTDCLPANFDTPLACFDEDPVYYRALRPSSKAQMSAVRTLRAQLRDYAGVFRALMSAKVPSLPIAVFSLKNFRWAISVVMTRQNALPNVADTSPRAQPVMGLVPLWDLFNHEYGRRTTLVTVSEGRVCVQCSAMRTFEKEEAVSMCYGPRPTPQLALYSGFVPADGTPYDEVHVCVSLFLPLLKKTELQRQENKDDEERHEMNQIAPLKARVLGKRGISIDLDPQHAGAFRCTVPIVRTHVSIDKLIGVAAVAVMRKDEFTKFLKSPSVLPSILSVQTLHYKELAFQLARDALMESKGPYMEAIAARDAQSSTSSDTTEDEASTQKESDNEKSNGVANGPDQQQQQYDGVDWNSPAGRLISSLFNVEMDILDNALEKLDSLESDALLSPVEAEEPAQCEAEKEVEAPPK